MIHRKSNSDKDLHHNKKNMEKYFYSRKLALSVGARHHRHLA